MLLCLMASHCKSQEGTIILVLVVDLKLQIGKRRTSEKRFSKY